MASWHQLIEDACDESELLAAAREYLDRWEAADLAQVPEPARPRKVKGIDDLGYWHQRLVDCYCTGSATGEEVEKVRDLLQFFAFALQRAAELAGRAPPTEREAAARLFSERSVPRLFTSAMTGAGEP